MPIDQMDIESLQVSMFGGSARIADATEIESEIARKFSELRELGRRLREVRSGASEWLSSRLMADSLNSSCPYAQVSVGRSGSLPGADAGFELSVSGAPFHVFDGSGKALHSTLPVNRMALRVSRGMMTSLLISGAGWRKFAGNPSNVAGIHEWSEFGHPHCSGKVSFGSASRTLDAQRMCTGNNNASHLLASMRCSTDLLLAIQAMYAWLTELNVDSTFHTEVAPIGINEQTMRYSIVPACTSAREKVMAFAQSSAYSKFVETIRNAGTGTVESEPFSKFVEKAGGALDGMPELEGTPMALHARKLLSAMASNARKCVPLAIGMHQLVSDILILGRQQNWTGGVLRKSASAGMVVLSDVWIDAADAVISLRGNDGIVSPREMKRYVADWEVMKNGSY